MFGILERFRRWRRERRTNAVSISDEMWDRAEARLPFLDYLEPEQRRRLRQLARAFIAEKQFYGAHDFALSDEVIVTIALQACLPVLRIGLHAYRGWVGVIVYPGDFVIPRKVMDETGVVHEYDDEVLGEAWEGGPVLVSWHDEADAPEGVNVVVHEFAHKLDMENGEVDGLPLLPPGMSRKAWAEAFSTAYERFCAQVDAGVETVLDPYGSESPGEFFAVASEAFFEAPCLLEEDFPAIYDQLRAFYGADPAEGERRLYGEPPRGANTGSP
ncbi:hypothetical protein GPA22_18050 [Aromatoleum toluvorans]|uniref:Zinc-dependent peptidase n=1 Tax=Aromatoleum toluvorans TaxID=92002 RepID=A0ABX1Q3Y4_9RHOO|nr:M90 family metallopeptidase [Aromatoleum toluvorans]NMG45622.1 hypothetical protein [Aromatoleum toluvorans]